MKEAELRKASNCAVCRRPFGHTGLPLFWRVTIERHGVDIAAVRRQDGLAQFLGHSAIASVMGPSEEMTKPMMEPITITVCETCATESHHCVALLAEIGAPSEKDAVPA